MKTVSYTHLDVYKRQVVPLYKTPEVFLTELIESMRSQTYGNWELRLSDGSGINSPLKGFLEEVCREEPRIKYTHSEIPLKISDNTNKAIGIATGDFIAFADHDDVLTEHALYECARLVNEHRDVDMIYSDEDKMSMDGHKFFQPRCV